MSMGRSFYSCLLRALPADFRTHRGPDLMGAYDEMRGELGEKPGPLTLGRFYLGLTTDLLRCFRQRRARATRDGWNGSGASRNSSPRFRGRGPRNLVDGIRSDVYLALRSLRKRPIFVLVGSLSLCIGVGANTAIFTVVDATLLSPPSGINEADRLVELTRVDEGHGPEGFSYLDFQDLSREVTAFEDVVAWDMQPLSLTQGEEGVMVFSFLVTSNYFQALKIGPPMGRYFVPAEDVGADQHFVTILSNRIWEERFGSDPNVIGRTIELNRHPYVVVGVAPADFSGHLIAYEPDVYIPLMQFPVVNNGIDRFESRSSGWLFLFARIRDGSSLDQARAALTTLYQRLALELPQSHATLTASAVRFAAVPAMVRGPVIGFLSILSALVLLVLLITSSNLAGVSLARAQEREHEIAVRLSLGSGRLALARQFIVEILLVFSLGGVLGILFATWLLSLIPLLDLPAPIPLNIDLSPNGRVFAFGMGLTLATGIGFGLLPAVKATRVSFSSVLKGDPSGSGRGAGWLRRSLVSAQVGLSLVLVMSSGLFVRSMQKAGGIETGFDAQDVYLTRFDLSMEGYSEDARADFYRQLLEDLSRRRWVESASISGDLPMDMGMSRTGFFSEDWESLGDGGTVGVLYDVVSPDYFKTLGIALEAGRLFDDSDVADGQRTCIVSRSFVRDLWPDMNPLGRDFHLYDAEGPSLRVVGVVADAKHALITDEDSPFVYMPLAQSTIRDGYVTVRSTSGIQVAGPELRRAVLEVDPKLTLTPVTDLEKYTSVGTLPQKAAAWITTPLALLALILSGIGIYGVVAHSVLLRTKEIGLRMALGAEQRSVLGLVVGGASKLALPGLVLGGIAAVLVGRILRSFLLGLGPGDPVVALGVVSAISAVVFLATFLPARRAVMVDPAETLRGE